MTTPKVYPFERSRSTNSLPGIKKESIEDQREAVVNFVKQDYQEVPLFKTYRPIFASLKVFGLFFTTTYFCRKGSCLVTPIWTLSKIYSALIVGASWLFVSRTLLVFTTNDTFGPELLFKLMNLFWVILCATNATSCYRGCARFNSLPNFFLLWDRLNPDGAPRCMEFCRKRTWVYMAVTWFMLTINWLLVSYAMLGTDSMSAYIPTFVRPKYHLFVIIYDIIVALPLTAMWFFPVIVNYIVSKTLYYHFNDLTTDISRHMCSEGNLIGKLESFRKRHQGICKLVRYADEFLSLQAASTVICKVMFKFLLSLQHIAFYNNLYKFYYCIGSPLSFQY